MLCSVRSLIAAVVCSRTCWLRPQLASGVNLGLVVGLLMSAGCAVNPGLQHAGMQLGLASGSHTQSQARLKFPAQTPVLLRFANSTVPASWAEAAHAGVLMYFPRAQRQQSESAGLQWLVRWPELPLAPATPANPAIKEPNDIGRPGPKSQLGKVKHSLAQMGAAAGRWLRPGQWRRGAQEEEPETVSGRAMAAAPIGEPAARGIVLIVVSDQASGKILAQAEVKIHRSYLARLAHRGRKAQQDQQARRNQAAIGSAFADLAANLVASGHS